MSLAARQRTTRNMETCDLCQEPVGTNWRWVEVGWSLACDAYIEKITAPLRAALAPVFALAERATPGEWRSIGESLYAGPRTDSMTLLSDNGHPNDTYSNLTADDCALIAAAVNVLPRLRALLEGETS